MFWRIPMNVPSDREPSGRHSRTCIWFAVLPAALVWSTIDRGANSTVAAPPPPRNLSPAGTIQEVHLLQQNWSDDEGNWFYNVPQGSKLLRYDWFLRLEQPDSEALFRDLEHVRSLGYLPRTPSSPGNPDGLPIGFVQDGEHLGLTCAACHTNQVNLGTRAWLVDGAPTLGDLARFQRRLVEALDKTLADPAKFDRFARRVLGAGAGDAARMGLKQDLRRAADARRSYNDRNLPATSAPLFGPGRVDAFGAILNEVTETFAQAPDNHAAANAPVSYPFLWDTPQHDHVQWNGAAENTDVPLLRGVLGTAHIGALGRNAGEVLGVFGTVDATHEGSLLQLQGYESSVNKGNLIDIEELLRKLWSPVWPAEFPPINESLRARGQQLFEDHCRSCHAPIKRDDQNRRVTADMRAVGTDQTMASNFATRSARSGVLAGRRASLTGFRVLGPVEPVKDLLIHVVQRVVVWPDRTGLFMSVGPDELLTRLELPLEYPIYAEIRVGDRKVVGAFNHLKLAQGQVQDVVSRKALRLQTATRQFRQDLSAIDDVGRFVSADGQTLRIDELPGIAHALTPAGTRLTFSEPAPIEFAYKGRPLNGIWATAPYLHNGSVPNLDELLKPAAQRVKTFKVGSRDFDPAAVGFRTDLGDFVFDATLPGNSNSGHEYDREFTPDERLQLIEYMKSL
jgi:mono/diheme cytochrome c family protein